jgi:hypothetical protein
MLNSSLSAPGIEDHLTGLERRDFAPSTPGLEEQPTEGSGRVGGWTVNANDPVRVAHRAQRIKGMLSRAQLLWLTSCFQHSNL